MERIVEPIVTDRKQLRLGSLKTSVEQVAELDLVERIKASTKTAWTAGVGLAAVQIGIHLRVGWFYDAEEDKEYTLINPVITKAEGDIAVPKEGCLSIPDVWTQTSRFRNITVATLTNDGIKQIEFSEFLAIVVQHEVDHMNGILNVDRRYIAPKVAGRNEPCPCGSGIKYKKCCIGKIVKQRLVKIPR